VKTRTLPMHCVVTALASAALTASIASAQVSTRSGVGAIPYQVGPGNYGVTFRTWAPNASSVFVAGSFNNWSSAATAL
jgi:1,4-alpha-glucan branching enzyme